jgi:hypothetical protein
MLNKGTLPCAYFYHCICVCVWGGGGGVGKLNDILYNAKSNLYM